MGKIWKVCVIVYLVCGLGLVAGSAPGHQSALDQGEGLGVDLCPECQSFASSVPGDVDRHVHEKEEEGLGMVMAFRPPISVASTPKQNLHGEELGSDMCPECRAISTSIPKTSTSSFDVEHHLGADMCPECRAPASEVPGVGHPSLCAERGGVDDKSVGCKWVDDLGVDMCPECRPLPTMPLCSTQQLHEGDLEVDWRTRGHNSKPFVPGPSPDVVSTPFEDLGADMCPECHLPVWSTTPSNFAKEEAYGVDMCPECRPLPTMPPNSPQQSHEGDLEVHMRTRGQSSKTFVPRPSPGVVTTPIEDLGADMCPECCRPLQSSTPSNFAQMSKEEAYGVDMCPECRPLPVEVPNDSSHTAKMHPQMTQLLSEAKDRHILSSLMDLSSVALELQKLALMQQAQLDQLGGLLQQFGGPHPSVETKATNLPKEQASSGTEQADTATISKPSERPSLDSISPSDSTNEFEPSSVEPRFHGSDAGTPKFDPITQQANRGSTNNGGRGMTVARYRPAWSEHFSFLSAVKVDGEVSCLHLLPQEGEDGTSRYVVIGDTTGRLYIFLWLGDLLLDYRTLSTSPITAMVSYTLQKNETILVTGHSDGAVLVHQVWEKEEQGSISDDGRITLFSIETLHTLVPPPRNSFVADPVSDKPEQGLMSLATSGEGVEEQSDDSKNTPVTNLEMYKVGKMRYTLVGDASGKIQLFRDNGSLHGVVQSPSRPLAFMRMPSTQRFIFLTEVGVGLLDFRSMQMRSYPCEGLNGSTVTAYSFDVMVRSKAHGFMSNGDLVSVALSGDMLHFECHVKRKRKLQITGPFVPQALKGYLITATRDRIIVFNTTLPTGLNYASLRFVGPTPLFSATMNEIALSFLRSPLKHSRWPVLATNRDRLVVVGFSDGYVGIFRSNLPTTKPADFTVKFWNSPILVSALAILVVWLIAKKRDPASVTVPDHSLMTPSGGLAFDKEESARLGFEQARKGAEPRRYRSPTRGYVDTKSASFASDSHFFRSSTVDTGIGYSGRREPFFTSTQPVGEMELQQ